MSAPSPSWDADQVIAHLKSLGIEENRAGMARFGINTAAALGISNAVLRPLGRALKRNHERSAALWASGIREARLLAGFTDEPNKVTRDQCRNWAGDFDSWEIVDGVSDLFIETPFWRELVAEFAADQREFVRRTAFAMLAWGAVHLKKEPDATFEGYLPLIEAHAGDGRNFVKKAVNWALRQIGKRSLALHRQALELAERLAASSDKTARWIGKDAVKELTDAKTLERLAKKR
jgi:3-methyladenine DNA glycosylase AlkD